MIGVQQSPSETCKAPQSSGPLPRALPQQSSANRDAGLALSALAVTASLLYSLIGYPHRVTLDLFGDPTERDEVSPFVKMLFERGILHEQATFSSLPVLAIDLSTYRGDEKERLTTEAIERGGPLIYGGRIRADDLLVEPDLLRRQGAGYVAGDIKSGAGIEGAEDLSKPKLHYAVQVALYTDILERKGWSAGRILGFEWRDTSPSGAASIEWFDRWTKTHDPAIRARIIDYNEDDCRATRVLLDAIRGL
jgi:hypothetical protein